MPNETNTRDAVFEWDETQLAAIDACTDMKNRIVGVTGAAGSGKTSVMRDIYFKLVEAGISVGIGAPTGKAAKRISEATGLPAATLHRLLEYPHPGARDPETGEALAPTVPQRDKKNPLPAEVYLIDEYAMVNRELHRNLIDALPRGGRLCMFGDENQLKPIETGKVRTRVSPFETVLKKFTSVTLTSNHRTAEGSGITAASRQILNNTIPKRSADFALKVSDKPVDALVDIVMEALDKGISFASRDAQILSATRHSWIGTHKLNLKMQMMLNHLPAKERIRLPRVEWEADNKVYIGVNDKVIWTENTYDMRDAHERYIEQDDFIVEALCPPEKMIMNGETGIITAINDDGGFDIDVGDRVVSVPSSYTYTDTRGRIVRIDPRTRCDLGYVITTHKSQGSEWGHVIYVTNKTTRNIQSRHNLYTAITRAKTHATWITDQQSLMTSLNNVESIRERQQR